MYACCDRFRLAANALAALLLLACLSGCQGGTPGGGLPEPDGSRTTPQPSEQSGGSGLQLPDPASVARQTSTTTPHFGTSGKSSIGTMPEHNFADAPNDCGDFKVSADQSPGELGPLAYAGYELRPQDQLNGDQRLRFDWVVPPKPGSFWVAVGNFRTARWDWKAGPTGNAGLDLSAHYGDYLSPTGQVLVEILIRGGTDAQLGSFVLGQPRGDSDVWANPDNAVGSLGTSIAAYFFIYGTHVVDSDWDLDGNGTFELKGQTTYSHPAVFSSPGIYHPQVRFNFANGGNYIEDCQVVVSDPANVAPVAKLKATPDGGAAPLEVTLDASSSQDLGGAPIVRYEWDLDDDGWYETDSGAEPTQSVLLGAAGAFTYRVRVSDSDLASSEAEKTVNITGGWQLHSQASSTNASGSISLAMVGPGGQQHPALVSRDTDSGTILYFNTQDLSGSTLLPPTMLDGGSCSDGQLFNVDGLPAIAFQKFDNSSGSFKRTVRFIRAQDAQGVNWNASTLVDEELGGYGIDVGIVNGRPAIVSVNENKQVMYSRAIDTAGLAWPQPQLVYQAPDGLYIGVPQLLGGSSQAPQVFFNTGGYSGIGENTSTWCATGLDETGSGFSAPERMMTHNCRPKAVLRSGSDVLFAGHDIWAPQEGLLFCRNAGGVSGAWQAPLKLDTHSSAGNSADMTLLDGMPVLIYTDDGDNNSNGQLWARFAKDPAGAEWDAPMLLVQHNSIGEDVKLISTIPGYLMGAWWDAAQSRIVTAVWQPQP